MKKFFLYFEIILIIILFPKFSKGNEALSHSKIVEKSDFYTFDKSFSDSDKTYSLDKYKYKTSFGHCPSEVAGKLTLKLISQFRKNYSLYSLKQIIISNKLKTRYYLSSYKISFDIALGVLKINLDCPQIIAKLHLSKVEGNDGYDALLMSDGQIFDATYEVILNNDKKLNYNIPYLSVPIENFDGNHSQYSKYFSKLLLSVDTSFRNKYLSEMVLNNEHSLMLVLSSKGGPTSVFLGTTNWKQKLLKLQKVYNFMKSNKKIPTIINLTNLKKIVVKFSKPF